MTKRKKVALLFCFVIIDMFLLIGFLVIRDAYDENKLKKEMHSLIKLDITKDRYNSKIKSRGNYGIVEESIKTYLDNYAVNLQEVLKLVNDPKFKSLLAVSNYEADGSEFRESKAYIKKKRESFNNDISHLIEACDEDAIKNYIYQSITDPYYVNLYQELMLDEDMTQDFLETKRMLEKTKIDVNKVFDTCIRVFDFLKLHATEWKIEDDQIKFQTIELVNQYNELIKEIK